MNNDGPDHDKTKVRAKRLARYYRRDHERPSLRPRKTGAETAIVML